MKAFSRVLWLLLGFQSLPNQIIGQSQDSTNLAGLNEQIATLKRGELVQSMSQRSLLLPSYFPEIKALTAKQGFNFWEENDGDKLVSHLNVYSALHDANKYLGYDSVNRTFYNQILAHDELVVSVEFGKNPDTFYSAGSDGRVLQWNLTDLNQPPIVLFEGEELYRSIDVSFDDNYLLAVTKEHGVILINIKPDETEIAIDNNSSYTISRDLEPVQTATFMPNSLEYLSISKTGELKLRGYKIDTVKAITDKTVRTMTVSEENSKVYAGTEQGVVQMWDADFEESLLMIPEQRAINALDISPDKTMLAIGREKGDAVIWDLKEEKIIRTISGHQSAIMDLEFSFDNKLLLTASRDGTSRVFEINNPRKLPMVFDDHDDWVMTAAFDRTASRAITGSKDGYIRIWELELDVLANRICEYVNREMTPEEWANYVGKDIPFRATCED